MADRVDTAMTELLLLGYMETVVKDGKIGYRVTEAGRNALAQAGCPRCGWKPGGVRLQACAHPFHFEYRGV